MARGLIENTGLICECGAIPKTIWFYVKGSANRKNYFVKCYKCNRRTLIEEN